MARRQLYWLCQTIGWGAVAAADFFFRLLVAEASGASLAAGLAVAAAGLAATHGVRGWIRSHAWLDLPLGSLAPRIIGASLGIGLCLASVGVLAAGSFRGLDARSGPHAYLWLACVGSGIGLAWVALYLAIQAYERTQREQRRRLELDIAARDAELAALHAQLDPHFLFNSLNGIRALIAEDGERARRAVTELAALLRDGTLQARRRVVPLADELRAVEHYLALESIRLEERLRTRIDLPEDLSELQVPTRSLQLLVENGVQHGVARQTEGGLLRVSIERPSHDLVRIEVRSPGPWAPSQSGDKIASGLGVGLENLVERLRLLYDDRARLELRQDADEVVAALVLPRGGPSRAWSEGATEPSPRPAPALDPHDAQTGAMVATVAT